jgi:hypothetical protein
MTLRRFGKPISLLADAKKRRFPRCWTRAGQRSRKGDACPRLRKARRCRVAASDPGNRSASRSTGQSRKRSGIDSKTAQFSSVTISSQFPLVHWRATALAFAVSGHQLVHIAPISLESLALPTGAGLSRTNSSLNDIQKPALAVVNSEILLTPLAPLV